MKTLALPSLPRVKPALLLAIAALALIAAFPALALEAAAFALGQLLAIAPAILLALLLTAAMSAAGAIALIARAFTGREIVMIAAASLIGALTPVCGVTVLPLVAGLLAAGVPLAPIMAFWLASPITDPGMLAITAATLGPGFALGKTLAALGCGLVGGGATLIATSAGAFANPARAVRAPMVDACGCDAPDVVLWRFWREEGRRRIFAATALDTGRLTLVWLTLAFLAEFFLRRYLPEAWVAGLVGGDGVLAVPIAALIGAPIYLDGYAALPLVRGLIDSGMRPDAAMAFLIAGGITSAWAAIPVYALVRRPVFAFYLVLAVVCSILSGWGYGLFAP